MNTKRPSWSTRMADLMVSRRMELLALAVLLATLAIFPATNVEMDRSLAHMFADDNPLMPPFRHFERVFQGNEVLLAVYRDPQLFDESGIGLERLAKIRESLVDVPGIAGAMSVDMIMGDRILDRETLIPIQVRELFEGFTHGTDGATVSILCILKPPTVREPRATTLQSLRRRIENLPDGLAPGMIAGEPVMIEDAFGYVDLDGHRLFTVTTVLLALVILACFRSIRWVCIPIAVVQLSLLFTNAVLGMLQMQLSMVSSMLTAVVTVVGVATVIHIIVRFREYRFAGHEAPEALRAACETLAVPITWACITDAVGFGALMFADVGPVRDFGLMMALGSLMVLLSVFLVVPGLALYGRLHSDPQSAWGEKTLDAHLIGIVNLVYRQPWLLGISALVFSIASIYGIRWLEVETDFTRNFRESTPIVRSYEIVESNLGGAGVLDILVPTSDHLSWPFLRQVLVMENDLRKNVLVATDDGAQPGLTKVLSMADTVVALSPRHPDTLRWERMRNAYISSALNTMRNKIPQFYDSLYAPDPDHPGQFVFRIMLRAKERQPSGQKQEIIRQVHEIAEKHFAEAETTGFFTLLTGLIDSILRDQWKTFGVALVGIFVTMILAFCNLRLAAIAIVPNAVPILIVSGLMGWFGFKVNMGAAMIAAVSMGLSIDSSIHYLIAYRRSRRTGVSPVRAMINVQKTVGRAMVFSTFALILGFAALATSEFVPTIYFGLLVSFSMLGGLFGNLVWLPLLLRMTVPRGQMVHDAAAITVATQRG